MHRKKISNTDIDVVKTNRWQKSGRLKAETEELIRAEQDQSLPIKNYLANIIKNRSILVRWDTNCNWYCHQRISTVTGELGNKRRKEDQSNEIKQNTKKSPGNMRRVVVTQTLVENHQITLVWKTLKRV